MGGPPPTKSTKKGGSPPRRGVSDCRYRDLNTPLHIVLCLLCLISVSFCGYFGYRLMKLEVRVHTLESELGRRTHSPDMDVLIERMRRDIDTKVLARVERSLTIRRKRDIEDCNCPPGKLFFIF